MRIAIFTDTYRPEINGVVTSIDTYRGELERQGHDVWIYCPRYFGQDDPDPRIVRIPSIPFPFRMMKERRLAWMGPVRLLQFGKINADVIHSQVPGNMGVAALLASAIWRTPHVHTYHTHYMEYVHYMPFPKGFSRRAVVWIARYFCGRCNFIVAPSTDIKDALLSYGIDAPVTVIPTGIDMTHRSTDTPLADLLARYGLGSGEYLSGKKLLVSVGRLGREKNIRFLIRAVSRIRDAGRPFHFFMIGDGPDRDQIEEEIRQRRIEDHVTLTGYIDRNDVLSFLRASDLFIFASKTETQGLVLLESMAMGTPVVAIRASGVSDLIVDDVGGILTPDDVECFSQTVIDILGSPSQYRLKRRQAMSRAALWSVENQARRLIAVYEAAIVELRRHGMPRFRRRYRF
jgi:1,2-diacylglycerol 3-alpha-glucosyltransferase